LFIDNHQKFASCFGEGKWVGGIVVPPLMIVLVGIGWLAWLMTSSKSPDVRRRERRG
jgi:hypothetical protein